MVSFTSQLLYPQEGTPVSRDAEWASELVRLVLWKRRISCPSQKSYYTILAAGIMNVL